VRLAFRFPSAARGGCPPGQRHSTAWHPLAQGAGEPLGTLPLLDEFEELPDEKNVTIPSSDREGRAEEAWLYGSEYYGLADAITTVLVEEMKGRGSPPRGAAGAGMPGHGTAPRGHRSSTDHSPRAGRSGAVTTRAPESPDLLTNARSPKARSGLRPPPFWDLRTCR